MQYVPQLSSDHSNFEIILPVNLLVQETRRKRFVFETSDVVVTVWTIGMRIKGHLPASMAIR